MRPESKRSAPLLRLFGIDPQALSPLERILFVGAVLLALLTGGQTLLDVRFYCGTDLRNRVVGERNPRMAYDLMIDVASRLTGRVQLTTDGLYWYPHAVEHAFGVDVDYAVLAKHYGGSEHSGRYSPARFIGATREVIRGNPDEKHISTSYVERQHLNLRMSNRRFTRLTNAFSKKIENHYHAVALHVMFYNFVRIHKTLRVTPAMAAGVSDRLWSIEDIVALIDAREVPPKKRGPYKPRQPKSAAAISN